MGCGGSKVNEEPKEENNHKLTVGGKVEKTKPKDLYTNNNTCITQCTTFYKKQTPPSSGEFKDELFPPNANSIYGKKADGTFIDTDGGRRAKVASSFNVKDENIEWLRAKDIYGAEAKIFGDSINIDDICQGEIGNCYFISTISALAEFPEAIAQLFKTTSIPENGCVEVAVEIDGIWKIVCLDDYFPCNKTTKKPLFANARGKELWPLFIEKAWAKVNGGYINIISGHPKEVFNAFTPFSTLNIEIKEENKQNLWKLIRDSDEYNCIMTCAIENNKGDLKKVGLVNNHVFTLVSAFERKIGDETVRLMKIRNPWGRGEWTGRWSDKSLTWTEEAKKVFTEFDPNAKDDGMYWMAFEDFYYYFDTVNICIPCTPLNITTIKVTREKAIGMKVAKVKMGSSGLLGASVCKKNYRFHRKLQTSMEAIDNVFIFKVENNSFKYIACGCNEGASAQVSAGEYIIYYNVDYKNGNYDHARGYTLKIASDKDVQVAEMPDDDKELSLLKSMLLPAIQANPKYADRFKSEMVFFTGNRFDESSIGFLYLKNKGAASRTIKAKMSLTNLVAFEKLPEGINLAKDNEFIYLFNRVKASKPFQSGLSLSIPPYNATFKEYPIKKEAVDKYINEGSYATLPVNFEYKQ